MPENIISNYYKYTVFLNKSMNREKLKNELKEKGVRCSREVYWPPLHLQPIFRELLNVRQGDYPLAEEACKRMICLPLHTSTTMARAPEEVNAKSIAMSYTSITTEISRKHACAYHPLILRRPDHPRSRRRKHQVARGLFLIKAYLPA